MADQPKPVSTRKDDVLSFLDDLDSFAAPVSNSKTPAPASARAPTPAGDSSAPNLKPPQTSPSAAAPPTEDAQSVLDFLDEITQRSATPTATLQTKKLTPGSRPLSRKLSASSIISNSANNNNTLPRKSTDSTRPIRSSNLSEPVDSPPPDSGGTWGWGSVLKQASSVLNQAKSAAGQVQSVVADPSKSSDLVKHLNHGIQNQLSGQSETAKKWKEGVMGYVKASGIDQLSKDLQATGMKSLTDIMNMVAPPISEHEIIEVQLSYDMIGYDGIETLVYRSLSKIMEQVDGGDLVLNKGEEEKHKERSSNTTDEPERDIQAVEGMTEGYKLALANLEQMIKRKSKSLDTTTTINEKTSAESDNNSSNNNNITSQELPITHCPVYVRIQPIITPLPGLIPTIQSSSNLQTESKSSSKPSTGGINITDEKHLFFLILLRDVNNLLDHATLSQSIPAVWLDIPFEENEWVEDVMVEVIRRATEVIGQQYVNGRLSGRSVKNSPNKQVEEGESEEIVATVEKGKEVKQ